MTGMPFPMIVEYAVTICNKIEISITIINDLTITERHLPISYL